MPKDSTEDAILPKSVKSIMAKALIGEKPPSNIPHNNRGIADSANTDRFAIVGEITAKRLVRINGANACHCDAPFPKR